MNDCDEFQFRYQFFTAIYAKNLQEDNTTRVFDLALFYTDLEIMFDTWTVLHSEGFDEIQFRYQFDTAIYAKNLQ